MQPARPGPGALTLQQVEGAERDGRRVRLGLGLAFVAVQLKLLLGRALQVLQRLLQAAKGGRDDAELAHHGQDLFTREPVP